MVLALGCLLASFGLAQGARFGACFAAHGRLQAFNGTPTFRIWPIGTHRLLGVHDDAENSHIPAAIRRAFGSNAFGKTIYADFTLCPLSEPRPGWMQLVRIKTASHLVVTQH